MTAGGSTVTYGYDGMGRIGSAGIPAGTFSYSYLNTSTKVVSLSRGGQEVVSKTYDQLARLTKISSFANSAPLREYSYVYNNSDERTKVTFADGKYIDYTYDLAGQLVTAQKFNAVGAMQLADYAYNYDSMGNPLQRNSNGQERSYTFNNLNQFTSATAPTKTDVAGVVGPEVVEPKVAVNGLPVPPADPDSEGNWIIKDIPLNTGSNTLTTEVKDKFNRVKTDTRSVTLAQAPVFTYDLNGNTTGDGTWTYTWNEENRLVEAIKSNAGIPACKLEFSYDGQGRRRVKKVYNWSGSDWLLSSELRFVYDQNNMVAELDANNAVQKSYTWGIDLSGSEQGAGGVGGLLSVSVGVLSVFFPSFDGNGNITAYLDTAGTVVYSCFYSPFGKTIEETGVKPCDFGFSTKPLDVETGLNYYIFRYYDQQLGRWLNRDPVGEEFFLKLFTKDKSDDEKEEIERKSLSALYIFLKNTPLTNHDYLGLITVPLIEGFCCSCSGGTWWTGPTPQSGTPCTPYEFILKKEIYIGQSPAVCGPRPTFPPTITCHGFCRLLFYYQCTRGTSVTTGKPVYIWIVIGKYAGICLP